MVTLLPFIYGTGSIRILLALIALVALLLVSTERQKNFKSSKNIVNINWPKLSFYVKNIFITIFCAVLKVDNI